MKPDPLYLVKTTRVFRTREEAFAEAQSIIAKDDNRRWKVQTFRLDRIYNEEHIETPDFVYGISVDLDKLPTTKKE